MPKEHLQRLLKINLFEIFDEFKYYHVGSVCIPDDIDSGLVNEYTLNWI